MSGIALLARKAVEAIVGTQDAHVGVVVGMVIDGSSGAKSTTYYLPDPASVLNYNQQTMTMGEGTMFEIASITKLFTAALLAHYAQSNASLFTQPVRDKNPPGMPLLPAPYSTITYQDLASYISGLPQDNQTGVVPGFVPLPYGAQSMYAFLHDGNVGLSGTPGGTYSYSNLGFALLARSLPVAIGKGSGSSAFAELVQKDLLDPLGMTDTRIFTNAPLTRMPLGIVNSSPVNPGWEVFPAYFGAGGLVSTPKDMILWLMFNMGLIPRIPLNSILATMQTARNYNAGPNAGQPISDGQGDGLGLGWFVTSLEVATGNVPIVWKNGALYGFSSAIALNQSSSPGKSASPAGVFVLTNSADDATSLAFAILAAMNGTQITPAELLRTRVKQRNTANSHRFRQSPALRHEGIGLMSS